MPHSKYSPSAAHRWMRCAASLQAGEGEETEYAKWGTETHEIAARMLLTSGRILHTVPGDEQTQVAADYVNKVHDVKGDGILLGVEQWLDFDHLLPPLGEKARLESQGGTIDAVCLSADGEEMQIHDLKTGKGVIVYAEDNEQLMLYAVTAMHHFGAVIGDVKRVRMCIHQQRAGHYDESVRTVEELRNFAQAVHDRILEIEVEGNNDEKPGEKQCRWCPRKAVCNAYAQFVQETVGATFDDLTEIAADAAGMGENRLSVAMAAVPMIENWCLAIRAKVEQELLAGRAIDGFKLVRGRKGNRQWTDDAAAIKMLKSMRLVDDLMYTKKVITPPAAEKLIKDGHISEKQFGRLESIITQSEGSLSVAPADDKRPAASPVAAVEDFADLTGTGA